MFYVLRRKAEALYRLKLTTYMKNLTELSR